MSISVVETAGSSAGWKVKKETITIGEATFALEKPFKKINPRIIAKHTGSLLVARRLEPNGEFTEVPRRHDYRVLPGKMDADEALRHLSKAASQNSLHIPAPPIVGYVEELGDNPDYFPVRRLGDITMMLPYTETDTLLAYRIQTASIVESAAQ